MLLHEKKWIIRQNVRRKGKTENDIWLIICLFSNEFRLKYFFLEINQRDIYIYIYIQFKLEF